MPVLQVSNCSELTSSAADPTDAGERSAIEFRGVGKQFAKTDPPVLEHVDLSVPPGGFVSMIGPSGCGKTTLLRIAGDLLRPSWGRVTIDGSPAGDAREEHKIGFVFQAPNLCSWRSVVRNVELPLEVMKIPRRERRQRALEQLDRVGLAGDGKKYPHQLSGGMAQRVSLARALVADAPTILMDEPFGALDEITRDHLNVELHELWRRTRKTILFVTHSIPEAVLLSTQIVVMDRWPGRIAEMIDVDLPEERSLDLTRSTDYLNVVARAKASLYDVMGRTTSPSTTHPQPQGTRTETTS